MNSKPHAVESAHGRMPEHHPGAKVRACLATVGGGDDELHGAEEVQASCTVEGDAAEGGAGERVEVDPEGLQGLSQPQSLGLPGGPPGEGQEVVRRRDRQKVGAPGGSQIGVEELKVGA